MKNKLIFSVMLVILLALTLACVSCDNGSTGGGGGIATNGKLTITGLESYNGYYIFARGATESADFWAAENLNPKYGIYAVTKISNGSATLKVWQVDENGTYAYSGNDQNVVFDVYIYSTATPSIDNRLAEGGTEKINFTDGVGSGSINKINPIPIVDIGNGIKARIKAYHYGPYNSTEQSYILLDFNSHCVAVDGNGDYKQDFEVKVDGQILSSYYIDISGEDIRFTSPDKDLITAGVEYSIQIKYTANPDRKIKVWIPKNDDDHWEPSGAYDILKSFDTEEKTVTADSW
jgi:hypothetical protein